MKLDEKGYSLVELAVVVALSALVTLAAGSAIFQILRGTDRNNEHMTVVRQVESAGYWLSRDAQQAYSVNITPQSPNFLILKWTEWQTGSGNITSFDHTATYSFDNLTGGIAKLRRTHSSNGTSQKTLVAEYIYYAPGDINTTKAVSYERPLLTVRVTSRFGDAQQTREYKIKHRP